MDGGAHRVAVLVCAAAGGPPHGALAVDDLCTNPKAAADALRASGATRVVLGLCHGAASRELAATLRRAGAEPLGVASVVVGGRDDAPRLLAAARARLERLSPDDRGRPALAPGLSRRTLLFSPHSAVEIHRVAVGDPGRCDGCGLCTAACPAAALGAGVVDESRCDGCGLCVPACPAGALHLSGAAPAQLEAELRELLPGTPGIAFREPVPDGFALVDAPVVTTGLRLQIAAQGAAVELDGFSRRVLAALGGEAARGPVVAAEPAATVDAVVRLAPSNCIVSFEDERSPLGLLSLEGPSCTLCGMCATACPAHALELRDGRSLLHDPARCTGCARCVDACPEQAIGVRRGLDVAALQRGVSPLVEAPREWCSACGEELPPPALRRRLRSRLPELAAAPLDRCAACARTG